MKYFGILSNRNAYPLVQRHWYDISRSDKFQRSKDLLELVRIFDEAMIAQNELQQAKTSTGEYVVASDSESYAVNFHPLGKVPNRSECVIIPYEYVQDRLPSMKNMTLVFRSYPNFTIIALLDEESVSPLVMIDSITVFLRAFVALAIPDDQTGLIDLSLHMSLLEEITDQLFLGGMLMPMDPPEIVKEISNRVQQTGFISRVRANFIEALLQ